MRRIVIHIGMEKTGSSALQAFLFRHRAALRMMGVRYPRPAARTDGARRKHQEIVEAVRAGTAGPLVERIAEEAERATVTVLSAEALSGPDPAYAQALAPLGRAADVRVVAFLRRQDEWALSAFRQAAVDGADAAAEGFERWLEREETRARLDYATMLGWWEDAFGADALRVRLYPHDLPIVPAFLSAADLPAASGLLPQGPGRVNESVDDATLIAALERLGAPAEVPALDQPSRNRLINQRAAGNEAIRARHLSHRETLFGVQ